MGASGNDPSLKGTHLVLFFTWGMSLRQWEEGGSLEREVALYRALQPHLGGITFVTYGDAGEEAFRSRLEGIDIVCNRHGLSMERYWQWLRWFPARWKRRGAVFKSNQMRGADRMLALGRRLGRPVVARCGFLNSEFTIRRHGEASAEAQAALALEHTVFRNADRVVVTTEAMRQAAIGQFGAEAWRVRVIPNYVTTDLFCPQGEEEPVANRLVFVGRLNEQKNLPALLEAIEDLPVELLLVGEGELRETLQARPGAEKVRFLGNRPHGELPGLIRSGALFVMPSLYEGHPKALLEAMSCGAAVLGTEVPGIREVIRHGVDGWLCPPDAVSLRGAIRELLARGELRRTLGEQARKRMLETVSLPRVVAQECALLAGLAETGRKSSGEC
ncbi:MAG: glycosyltransferase family 4 protein [Magnetococcales bacterium]|nr:glycosyltransferase family 4 protein [Magnetococcales bacterium]